VFIAAHTLRSYHIAHLQQKCHNSKSVILWENVSDALQFSVIATMTQLPSVGEFYELRYDTLPVKNAYVNVSSYTSDSKMPNFESGHSFRK
jgi:hypothetical protein